MNRIVRDIIDHWSDDWRCNQPLFWLELLGTLGSIAGSITLSVFIKASPLMLAYTFWLFGSALLMICAYLRKAGWFFVLMLFNTIMNIVGLALLTL